MFTILLLSVIVGQCGPKGCPSPMLTPSVSPSVVSYPMASQGVLTYDGPALTEYERPRPKRVYGWHPVEHDGLVFQVWGYLEANGKCRWQQTLSENRASWYAAIEASKAKAQPAADLSQTGIDPAKLTGDGSYRAPSEESRRFVASLKSIEADNAKVHVTVIGSEADCAPVIKDLTDPAGPFEPMRAQLAIQDFRPDEWQVDSGLGFNVTGKPSIIVQSGKGPLDPRGGKVLYRANDYAAGSAPMVQAIRKANPSYKPEDDPGPATGKTDDSLAVYLLSNPILIWSAVTFVLLMLLPPRKDS